MSLTQNFPGVYPTIRDASYTTEISSRFRAGIAGVTTKGSFNTATSVRSVRDFISIFGRKVTGDHWTAQTVALMADVSDGVTVVRVGNQFTELTTSASGPAYQSKVIADGVNQLTAGDYVRIAKVGLPTILAQVSGTITGTTANLVENDTYGTASEASVTIADNMSSATLSYSSTPDAANEAESFLYEWSGTGTTNTGATGNKNGYVLTKAALLSNFTLVAGDTVNITESGKATTREARVKAVTLAQGSTAATLTLESTTLAEYGFTPVALQDTYTAAAVITKVTTGTPVVGSTVARCLHLHAASAGSWANTTSTTGLTVKVKPGSKADTKKIEVYDGGALVEQFDNVTFSDSTSTDYVETRINGVSGLITVDHLTSNPPANTLSGWSSSAISVNSATFDLGQDGSNPAASDVVGEILSDGTPTGLKVFSDVEEGLDLGFILVADALAENEGVAQEAARIAKSIHAAHIFHVPESINLRGAVDWQNKVGLYSSTGIRLDNYAAFAPYWNWIETTDPLDGSAWSCPPSVAALYAIARTHDTDKPWYAAAGENRGSIPWATDVAYRRVSEDDKQASYGNGNAVNSILYSRGRIRVYGDRTTQRLESKLTAAHNVVLVQYVVRNMALIGRQFVFEPNDSILLTQIRAAYTAFLEQVRADRGIEGYELVVDGTNNTADTRNERKVIVDLNIIPTDVAERIFLNVTVNSSGAIINSVI